LVDVDADFAAIAQRGLHRDDMHDVLCHCAHTDLQLEYPMSV
jgi:hypothetical protein